MSKKSREWVKQRKIQAEDEQFQGQAEARPGTTVEYYSTSLDLQVEGDGQRWSARSGWCQETWRGLRAVSTASKSCVQTGCCSIPIGQRLHPRPPVQRRTPLLMGNDFKDAKYRDDDLSKQGAWMWIMLDKD
ncbi:hypothetical protein I7I51_04273 [Histoplasma capsulatum]|uniref:Uncharacterized protein n=1 Tax=Ajellomyces capsulatus TaxID=5037 RepID=A0A8A1M6G9_AJECA|nr:hypothetical protein I7I51_04273 [Histoplasma capsulatum]